MQNIKVVLVGDSQVGKTFLLNKTANLPLNDSSTGNASIIVTVDNTPVNIGLWDTAGSAEYDRLRPLSYPCTEAFLLCFSLVSNDSFENISQKWIPEVRKYHIANIPLILIGTKKDMRDDPQVLEQLQEKPISTEEVKRKSKEIDAYGYVECSAVTGEGVQDILEMAVRTVIHPRTQPRKKKGCCII